MSSVWLLDANTATLSAPARADRPSKRNYAEVTRPMERKPSLIQYYWYELKWAFATTLDWTRLLFKDRRVAMAQLREGLKSEHFRERTRGWTRVTSFTYGRLRVTAPIIVGCAVGLYCGFMQSSLLMALVFGFMAGIFTSLALRALPFAMLASVPLLAFLLIRSILPANVPDLPAELVAKLQSGVGRRFI